MPELQIAYGQTDRQTDRLTDISTSGALSSKLIFFNYNSIQYKVFTINLKRSLRLVVAAVPESGYDALCIGVTESAERFYDVMEIHIHDIRTEE